MYSDKPMSTDKTSKAGYDAKINPPSHLCLINDEAKVSGEVCGIHDGYTAPGTFPQFAQLPPELRQKIWHFYCPDLSVKARVLPFRKWPGSTLLDPPNDLSAPHYRALADQTRTLRATLSTHRESRSIAWRKYPDELVINATSGTIVRFRKETDVIFLMQSSVSADEFYFRAFGSKVENLALGIVEVSGDRCFYEDALLYKLPAFKRLFPNLRRLFGHWPTLTLPTELEEWCLSESVHSYIVRTDCRRESGLGELKNTLFCWPDLDAYPDFARSSVTKLCSLEKMDKKGVELWPIVEFESETSLQMYDPDMMRRLYGDSYFTSYGKYNPSSEDDVSSVDGSDPDECNSEGIDDDEVKELLAASKVELTLGEIALFSCARSNDVQVSAEFNVDSYSSLHKRKIIFVATDDEEEDEMGHDDDGGRSENKRARLSRPILGFDEKDEEQVEVLQPDQDEVNLKSNEPLAEPVH
ncbi:hypothetical protein E4U60_004418 [Claviceps pazoutovae]|uniref:2EXR domain-containing protein n=1 Tax=Claviceps pazoutovae TaxID=1649127 RepID=A0A9P7SFG8_9HYPO|nr:hypothetical protein E4U60_004418 [Claviceps pazoutovae]